MPIHAFWLWVELPSRPLNPLLLLSQEAKSVIAHRGVEKVSFIQTSRVPGFPPSLE